VTRRSPENASVRVFITGLIRSRSNCRRCESGKRTSAARHHVRESFAQQLGKRNLDFAGSVQKLLDIAGGKCAECKTQWNTPLWCPRAGPDYGEELRLKCSCQSPCKKPSARQANEQPVCSLSEMERNAILDALAMPRQQEESAELLGIQRPTL